MFNAARCQDLQHRATKCWWNWSAGQLAGFVEHFRGFTFATVRGAGHMVRSSRQPSVQLRAGMPAA